MIDLKIKQVFCSKKHNKKKMCKGSNLFLKIRKSKM